MMALVSDSYTLLDRITEQTQLIVELKKNPRTTPPSDEKPECTVQKGKLSPATTTASPTASVRRPTTPS